MDVKLKVNGQEFELPYRLMEAIVHRIGDGEHFAGLVRAIIALNIPSLTKYLVDKACLTTGERDEIWASGTDDIKIALLDTQQFVDMLSEEQAREIMEKKQPEMLEKVAELAERLYPDKDSDQATRISGQMADELLEMIAQHPDEDVRRKLMANPKAPSKFKPVLPEIKRIHTDLPSSCVRYISRNDVAMFKNANLDVLTTIAENIEEIKDKVAQEELGNYLAIHRDPEVRQALARNFSAPRNLLEILANDPDADIAADALENLE